MPTTPLPSTSPFNRGGLGFGVAVAVAPVFVLLALSAVQSRYEYAWPFVRPVCGYGEDVAKGVPLQSAGGVLPLAYTSL